MVTYTDLVKELTDSGMTEEEAGEYIRNMMELDDVLTRLITNHLKKSNLTSPSAASSASSSSEPDGA